MTSEAIKHHFIVYIKLISLLVFNTRTPNNNKPAQTDTAAAQNMSRSPDATQNLQVLLVPCNESCVWKQADDAVTANNCMCIKLTSFLNTCTPNMYSDWHCCCSKHVQATRCHTKPASFTGTMQWKLCLKTVWWCSHSQQLHVHQVHQFSCL